MNDQYASTVSSFRRRLRLWPAAVMAVAIVTAFAAGRASLLATAAPVTHPEPQAVQAQASPPVPLVQGSYSAIVDQVAPSVVTVRVEKRPTATETAWPPEFERFFGPGPGPGERNGGRVRGLGSGVIVSADGYILTNHHVVEDAQRIVVDLADGRSAPATVVGSDPPSDLALLRIKETGLRALPFGDAERVKVGDVVLAFGNPLGVGQTVTMGIVSAKGRATGVGDGNYEDFLQTDAPINQGNSGGALVNLRGELVGINAQILSQSGGNIGIGFAIPSTMARAVTEQLMKDGVVHRARLGVTVQGLNADLARSLGVDGVHGALVSGVEAGSPGERAGLRQGDVITRIDGREVADANALRNQVAGSRPGTEVTLTVRRDGRSEQITARLAERTDEGARASRASSRDGGEGLDEGRVGMTVQPLNPDLAREAGVSRDQKGLVVTDVDPAGVAAEAGVRPGDVIKQVDGQAVTSVQELRSRLSASHDRPALLLLARRGGDLFVALPMSAS